MQERSINQENDIRELDFLENLQATGKKATVHIPSAISELNECRFPGLQKPEYRSDIKQE